MTVVCFIIGVALLSIPWLYVMARVATRGILRTLEERRRNRE